MNILSFVKRHSVLTYFILTFVISWGGLLLVIGGPNQIAVVTPKFNELLPIVILAILAGPSISGILLTILVGRKSFREFKLNLTRKVNLKWYLFVLLGALLAVGAVYFLLSLFSSKFTPGIITADGKIPHLIMGIMTGVAAGFFEEIGWTGFAIPRLLKKNSVLRTGLIVGIIWAVWHILPGLWLGYASGTITNTISLISYVFDPFCFLVIYRILMVWVYKQTESLPVAMVMHGALTAGARIFTPMGIVGIPLLIFDIVWASLLVVVTFTLVERQAKDYIPKKAGVRKTNY